MTHLIVLVIELTKTLINLNNAQENDKARQKKRMYILQQAVSVCRWVSSFNPEHINAADLILPLELKQLNEYSKALIADFPKLD